MKTDEVTVVVARDDNPENPALIAISGGTKSHYEKPKRINDLRSRNFLYLFKGGEELDIIIDVTGIKSVRDQLRSYMQTSENNHTVIMHERISALLVSLFNGKLVDMKASDGVY